MTDNEAEYNNRAKVPEHPAIMAGWARDAAAFRAAQAHAELDLSYGPTPRQAMDLFWPGATHDAPIALFIHGGYWQALDKSMFSHLARGLLAHGVAVAVPSYDLCPQVTLTELTEQLRDAVAFLHRRHARRLLATGHSAGGHLAAMLMATDWPARGLPADLVPAGLPISGLFDLPPLMRTSVNAALRLDEAEARRLSPMFMPHPGGRIHAIVGADEGAEYLRQSRGIAEAWGGTWEALPGHNHFTIVGQLADPGSAMVRKARDLLP
ncbi:alpha/beta hydrolase [Limobrevibacterium gyesilva]|uniref:Alpha/beta hydrolase n=1 Tax=Limobrevibacterium gyesilva TaxID=2991712 RepID=A0AA42CG62_9PROT|nr:alpha/beta hydrolase [Limobrevibacterium gyesilva]MCW3473510.1 alpha/beta hydrolase [Limobrevibacterium gyesilva]